MKKILLLPILLFVCHIASAQVSADAAVMITATVKETPASITLHWNYYTDTSSFTIYRKNETSQMWGVAVTTVKGTDSSYTDSNVIADSAYEYRISRTGGPVPADGYIYAAVKLHATDYRGKLLLIVDSTFIDSLSSEVTQVMNDISADGWAVDRYYVSRNATPPTVKNIILNEYNANPKDVKALFLLGHVPVPYSGDLNPDAHPDHLGAWPADVYYGDMTGTYSDYVVDDTLAADPRNRNKPGDGKFDQSTISAYISLEIGRVDLFDMPSFNKAESQLLKQYLNRDHDYRFKNFTTIARGLIHDDFGYFNGEAFASCGWRNFVPMFGTAGVHAIGANEYFDTLSAQNYLWSYGCGGGNPQGAGGIGSTSDFVTDSVKTVFTMLFGSYFGDWGYQDDFLRAPLASPGLALTCCWAGRPYWFFHHMVLGENIGFAALIAQNNSYYLPYNGSYGSNFVHIALMGDPTLRQHVITPPSNVTFNTDTSKVTLHWNASPDTGVAGYYVYRSTARYGEYYRVSPSIITSNLYIDMPPVSGLYYYYVKAVKWEYTPSGTYLNTSEGEGDSTTVFVLQSGIVQVNKQPGEINVYPNPANETTSVQWLNTPQAEYNVSVKDELGRTIFNTLVNVSSANYSLPILVKGWTAGCYFIEAKNINNQFMQKMVVVH